MLFFPKAGGTSVLLHHREMLGAVLGATFPAPAGTGWEVMKRGPLLPRAPAEISSDRGFRETPRLFCVTLATSSAPGRQQGEDERRRQLRKKAIVCSSASKELENR